MKEIIDKTDFIKIKNFCCARDALKIIRHNVGDRKESYFYPPGQYIYRVSGFLKL